VRILTKYPQERAVLRPVLLLPALLVVQLGLGGASYFLKMAAMNAPQPLSPLIEINAAHVAVGALVLATTLVSTLHVFNNVAAPPIIRGTRAEQERERLARKPRMTSPGYDRSAYRSRLSLTHFERAQQARMSPDSGSVYGASKSPNLPSFPVATKTSGPSGSSTESNKSPLTGYRNRGPEESMAWDRQQSTQ
jgi:hypothetical protein